MVPWMRVGFCAAVLFAMSGAASDEPGPMTQPAGAATKPVDPAFVEVEDVAGLPRVLIIGDSISIGYTLDVRADLKGKANVHRPAENCGDTGRGLAKLDKWLGNGKWDVIHFNFGLHDLKYLDAAGKYVNSPEGKQVRSPEEYAKNLREIVARLKKTGAKLIFATTTPVPAGTLGRIEGDEKKYNEAAMKVMKEEGVAVDDIGAIAARDQATIQRAKNVHFTEAGYKELAEAVSASIEKALGK